MKVIFTLGSAVVGGGTNVIFEHATRMVDEGEDVYIITDRHIEPEEYAWHASAHKLKWITYDDLEGMTFDVAIGTWWRTIYELYRIKAKQYIYFIQSIESRFYPDSEVGIKMLVDLTYALGLKVITEATWIKEWLERKYGLDVTLVKNGLKKEIFTKEGDTYDKCEGLRVLIEGPVDVDFKNVPKTRDLVNKSNASEVWLLTSSEIKSFKGVDRVFSRIPVKDCAKIYRSCDLIVKLSYVEGMFGPPLEMFHCGGTCIVYDVTGHDEYIKDGYNGYVVKTDDDEKVVEYINKLCEDKKELNRLKKNALATANKWPSWKESSGEFYEAVKNICKKEKMANDVLEYKSKFFFDIYVNYEKSNQQGNNTVNNKSFKRKMGDKFREKLPKTYKVYYKIVHKLKK